MLGYQEEDIGTTSEEWRQRIHLDDLHRYSNVTKTTSQAKPHFM
jgi:hypothetical protein